MLSEEAVFAVCPWVELIRPLEDLISTDSTGSGTLAAATDLIGKGGRDVLFPDAFLSDPSNFAIESSLLGVSRDRLLSDFALLIRRFGDSPSLVLLTRRRDDFLAVVGLDFGLRGTSDISRLLRIGTS